MNAVAQKLQSRNIRAIYCVDDENVRPKVRSADRLAKLFLEGSPRQARLLGKECQLFEPVVGIKLAADTGDRSPELYDELLAALEDLFESGDLREDHLDLAVDRFCPKPEGVIKKKIAPLIHGDGITFEAMGFTEWNERSENIISSASEAGRILLLLDEKNEFEDERPDLNGEAILRQLAMAGNGSSLEIDCIVVTGECGSDDELVESHRLYTQIVDAVKESAPDLMFRKVFVLAKERLEQADIAETFSLHLDRVELARLGQDLALKTRDVLQHAVGESIRWLNEITLPEFHSSIFLSSQNEGAAEIDTLVRLVSIKQRSALEKRLRAGDDLRKCIEQIRGYSTRSLGAIQSASFDQLKMLRQEEFERTGNHINELLAPIACGDVFEIETRDDEGHQSSCTAILLANPCDLVVRSDGKRKLNTGFLVRIDKLEKNAAREIIAGERSAAPLLYSINTGEREDSTTYLFWNSKVEAIPLHVLDLCWNNYDGRASLVDDMSSIGEVLSNSQTVRRDILISRLRKSAFGKIELWEGALHPDLTQQSDAHPAAVTYGIRRVWRLAPEFAAAALSALASALSRPTFGHDYLRS